MSDVDRVTLELVAERIKGLSALTDQGFKDMQRQLDEVRGLPTIVGKMSSDFAGLERRVTAIEDDRGRGAEFRRGNLPIILLTLALAITSLVSVLSQLKI